MLYKSYDISWRRTSNQIIKDLHIRKQIPWRIQGTIASENNHTGGCPTLFLIKCICCTYQRFFFRYYIQILQELPWIVVDPSSELMPIHAQRQSMWHGDAKMGIKILQMHTVWRWLLLKNRPYQHFEVEVTHLFLPCKRSTGSSQVTC